MTKQRIRFQAAPAELQWLDVEDNVIFDTSKDDRYDAMLRGAVVRNVVVGETIEINFPAHGGIDGWQACPLVVLSVADL